ncbi:Teratocarcinoma-derived growth factor [Bulinus truncatus]|nr:Teratocarcinoma-derived growth factor [Bulinus truncatus]
MGWEYGSMGVCECGSMGVWEYGSVGVWEYVSVGIWEYGSMRVCECGSMGVWEYVSVGVWEYGSMIMMISLIKANQAETTGHSESSTSTYGATRHPSLLLLQLLPTVKESSKLPGENLEHKNVNQTCCENGGLCVMGVFCHCTEKYYGFRCEFERQPCGPIAHSQWARLGCNLCRCFDAQLHCLAKVYSGCDDKPLKTSIDISDYPNDIKIFPNDDSSSNQAIGYDNMPTDNDYDDYEESPDLTSTNNNKRKNVKSSIGSGSSKQPAPSLKCVTLLTLISVMLLTQLPLHISTFVIHWNYS